MGQEKQETRAGGCDTEVVTASRHIVTRDEPRPPPPSSKGAQPTESAPEPITRRFVPGLDGLRGVAVLAGMGRAGLSAVFSGLVVAALLAATVTPGAAVLPIGSRPPTHFVGPAGVGAAHPSTPFCSGTRWP